MNDFIENALKRYKTSVEKWRHIYDDALNDLKFVYDIDNGQWPEDVVRERGNRPIITVNKLLKFVRHLRCELAINKPGIDVIPVDSRADVEIAKIYKGLIKEIEYLSSAETAYATAYTYAVAGSVGYFRIIADYIDDTFEQELKIKRILNPMAVHFGPAMEFTMEDADWCFVEDRLSIEDFKRRYPSAQAVDFDGKHDWFDEDGVRIAEYFWKEKEKRKKALLETGEEVWLDEDNLRLIELSGVRVVKERTVDKCKVMWCKMSGAEILEEEREWPGKNIPIIPVFGDEIVIEGKKHYMSLVRGAKGIARMYNFWATAATENVAMIPKNPYVLDHRQVKGFENEWEEANVKNRMFVRYNHLAGMPKPQRDPQATIPNAIMGMMQATAYDIEDHLGRYESSKGQASNERSRVAIMARVAQSEKGSFFFIDNFQRALIYAGRQLIDLIPKIYDTNRLLRVMDETGSTGLVEVNKPALNDRGEPLMENDLAAGRYDLIATVNTAYSSKRQEMVEMMIQSMQYAPTLAPVIAPLIFKYSDWPGAEEIYNEVQKEVERQKVRPPEGNIPQGGIPESM